MPTLFTHRIKKAIATPEYVKILTLRTVGNFLVFSSLFMIAKTFYQPIMAEATYVLNSYTQKQYVVADDTNNPNVQQKVAEIEAQPRGGLAKVLNIAPVEILTPVDPEYSIVIPKIGANAKIIPNVDAADEGKYLGALRQGVAHTLGTAFPGEGGHIYLFAHSTDYIWNVGSYNAIFYLLYKLDKGDDINVYYKKQRYVYRVIDKRVIDPSQVEFLTRKTNNEFLTLQTCWPPGTTLQRLLVFATRVQE